MPKRIPDFNFNQKIRKAKKDPNSINYRLMFKRYVLTERQWKKLLSIPELSLQWSWIIWGETQEFTSKVVEMILNSDVLNPPSRWIFEQIQIHNGYLDSYKQKLIDAALSYPVHLPGCCSYYDKEFRTEHSPNVQSKYLLRELSLMEGIFSSEEIEDYISRGLLIGTPNELSPALTRQYMSNLLRESKNWHKVAPEFFADDISNYLDRILPNVRNFYFLKLCLDSSPGAGRAIIYACSDLPKEIIDLILDKIEPRNLITRSYSGKPSILDNFLSRNILTSEQVVRIFKLISQAGGIDPQLTFKSIIQLIHQIQPAFTYSFLTDPKEEKRDWAKRLLSGVQNITFPENPNEEETDSPETEETSNPCNLY